MPTSNTDSIPTSIADSQPLIELRQVSVSHSGHFVLTDLNLVMRKDEKWAIIGRSGSGKTTLAKVIAGMIPASGSIHFYFGSPLNYKPLVSLIEQQHYFKNLFNTTDFYYQQRFNSQDAENTITVAQALKNYGATEADLHDAQSWVYVLSLHPLLAKPLIQLSNGENRRLQLAEALFSGPDLLIMDNPFTGLDRSGREVLHGIIDQIHSKGVQVILMMSDVKDLPQSITHIGLLEGGRLIANGKKEDLSLAGLSLKKNGFAPEQLATIRQAYPQTEFQNAVRMVNVSIHYGNKEILKDVSWTVRNGECWSVSGPNGAGKSTLLSLITGDNPQAYANVIYLFDQRRGKGESIWDIKRRIGYVSPELHLFFEQHNSCFDIVASGLFDTIGLFRKLNDFQIEMVEFWLNLLQLLPLQRQPFFRLSLGEQRMVLLARALVKNPPVLILDEPCQGLDDGQRELFKTLIDTICTNFHTTLLYVSHYEHEVPDCVNNFIRLENGRIIDLQIAG